MLNALATNLKDRGKLDLSECLIDGTLVMAKQGGMEWEKTKRGKGAKLRAMTDGTGLPLALATALASPHEGTLITTTLIARCINALPQRLIGDRA